MNRILNPLSSPLRMMMATTAVALAGMVSQTAFAAPPDGSMSGPMGGPFGGPGMHHGMGGPHMMGRMLDAVNATPDQRKQIKTIMEAAHKDLAAMHENGRKLREQGQAVFAQPNIDARAAETLRQQMLAQHDAASKRMLQAMLDASNVLTPDQRKVLAEKMAQRRSMMERHRAERRQLDAPPSK